MPRWLSSKKMDVVKAILAEDPAMLLRESMGVAADSSNKAFASKEVDAFAQRATDLTDDSQAIFVLAVDPAGGGTSQFAVASLHQNSNGTMGVRARPACIVFPPRHVPNVSTAVVEEGVALRRCWKAVFSSPEVGQDDRAADVLPHGLTAVVEVSRREQRQRTLETRSVRVSSKVETNLWQPGHGSKQEGALALQSRLSTLLVVHAHDVLNLLRRCPGGFAATALATTE